MSTRLAYGTQLVGGSGGAGGEGGHVIENSSGTDLTQRDTLKFAGVALAASDDSTNEKTIVNADPVQITYAAWSALTQAERDAGFWMITDYPDGSGGGSGCHVIQNASGTDMTQRSKLQFVGATVSDDSVGDKTVVNMPSATPKSTTAQFDTVNGGVLDKCLVTLSPVQSGSGEPAPDNVRLISGHTEVDVEMVGKNLIETPFYDGTTKNQNNVTFTVNADYSISVSINGTASADTYYNIVQNTAAVPDYIQFGQSYIINGGASNDVTVEYADNKSGWGNYARSNGADVSFTPRADITYVAIYVLVKSGTSGNYTVYPMIRYANAMDSSYEPYQLLSVQIPLGDTYYSGTLDVVSGELIIDKKYVEYDGSNDESITAMADKRCAVSCTADSITWSDQISVTNKLYCNRFKETTNASTYGGAIGFHFRTNGTHQFVFSLGASGYATDADWRNWFVNNHTQVVYPIETPVTVQLTTQQVTALVGQNNISAPLDGQTVTDAVYKELFTFDDVQQDVVRKRTQAQYDAMSAADKAKGIIEITDADAKPLFDTQVRRSNGDGTVADALDNVTVRHEVVTVTVTSGNAVLNSTDYAITNRTILAARSGDYIILPYADRNGVWNVRVLTSAGTPEQSNTINIRIFYIPYVA